MALHPQAGQLVTHDKLVNVPELMSAYYTQLPDIEDPTQAVTFGTSGHRGSSLLNSFNERHIAAICQSLCDYRVTQNITGPMFIGMDTHALSQAAFRTSIEVMVANDVDVVIQEKQGYTPTPVISHAILNHNKDKTQGWGDGIVITPSHNPPEDGGIKYNPPHGGPADSDVTTIIQNNANDLIRGNLKKVKRVSFEQAMSSDKVREVDFSVDYIEQLDQVIDMQAIRDANLKLATDPLGGAGLAYWRKINERYGLNIDVVNDRTDPTFSFMSLDKDGKVRMDCSSAYAMSGLIKLREDYDLAFGNDPDFDRHGIVTKHAGLMNPNHYLAVVIDYLYQNRPEWPESLNVGKTLVSSSMIDRVVKKLGKPLLEMPVGFKWFVQGMFNSQIGFSGEESAGGIFLRRNGQPWATDKDGIILCLLAAEILAKTGLDPSQHYERLTEEFGQPLYKRVDVAATLTQKKALSSLKAEDIQSSELAGESITNVQTHAPGNNAAIGGVKVSTENGWFAARPSGTENVYKIYAESFLGQEHLDALISEAEVLVQRVFDGAGD
jgi:phosphoglucomutase